MCLFMHETLNKDFSLTVTKDDMAMLDMYLSLF